MLGMCSEIGELFVGIDISVGVGECATLKMNLGKTVLLDQMLNVRCSVQCFRERPFSNCVAVREHRFHLRRKFKR